MRTIQRHIVDGISNNAIRDDIGSLLF